MTKLKLVPGLDVYMSHPLRPRLQQLSCSFEQTCFDTATVGAYSNSWTVLALTDAVGMKFRLVYPHVNGKNDIAFQTLNTVFMPTDVISDRELSVLWYRMGDSEPVPGAWYTVNHFAAVSDVVPRDIPFTAEKSYVNSPITETIEIDESDSECLKRARSPSSESKWRLPKRKRSSSSSCLSVENELSISNRFDALTDESDESDTDSESEEDSENDHNSKPDTPPSSVGRKLSEQRFLDNDELLCALMKNENLLDRVPLGPKNDNV